MENLPPIAEGDRKQGILYAAMGLFSAQGYANTSMNDIIAASGLSKGGVYHHFASKKAVIIGVLDLMIEIERQMFSQPPGSRSFIAQIELQVAQVQQMLEQMGSFARLFLEFYLIAMDEPDIKEKVTEQYYWVREQMLIRVEHGQAAGELRQDYSAMQITQLILANFNGLNAISAVFPGPDFSEQQQMLEALPILLDAIKAH